MEYLAVLLYGIAGLLWSWLWLLIICMPISNWQNHGADLTFWVSLARACFYTTLTCHMARFLFPKIENHLNNALDRF